MCDGVRCGDHALGSYEAIAAYHKFSDKIPVEGSIRPNADPLTAAIGGGEEFLTAREAFDISMSEPECNRGSAVDELEGHEGFLASEKVWMAPRRALARPR